MNIKKFNKFLKGDFLLESLINESKVYYAPPLRSTLLDIKNEYNDNTGKIADDLLSLEDVDVKGTDITFINLSNDAGYFTHNTMKKVVKSTEPLLNKGKKTNIDKELSDMIYNSEMNLSSPTNLYNGNKNQIKIGRAIQIFF